MTARAPQGRNLLLKLLDFERSPGRYPVALREPRPLFDHVHSVMQLAAGRPVDGLRVAAANEHELQRAARFFVRTVLLRPGADPLTLLGLHPGFEPEQLREHYRLMIRLTHPDFVAQGERWPADAATRINLAKDMLSSPQMVAGHATTQAPAQMGGAPAWEPAARVARIKHPPRSRPMMLPKPGASTAQQDPHARTAGWGPGGSSNDDHWAAPRRRWTLRAKLALIGMGALLMTGVLLFT
ncbi:J domain-containing protein [Hydrogenophaga sp. BPS33]|uniref:J domain-containing protein n=1 Tax=Hydrogenophaga sp. BPS33 TaxID=2651974 RepID=UPI0013201F31|nr:J domain-containing protein [Hydrogenophaga sp. BPS33]QHE88551.1 J domain-containing protein [Hydrogenophaga sp. BPS33]